MSAALREEIYRRYMTFFEVAERKRRWSVFDDIPWDALERGKSTPELALCAETFCGVEMYLPDYVSQGIEVGRVTFGEAWFMACWGYEESKHALVLREYLLRSGQRTQEQVDTFERQVLSRRWQRPFDTARRMVAYGALQELVTFMMYRKQRAQAEAAGDEVLSAIYRYVGADEAAHAGFYQDLLALYLDDDRAGALKDLHHVLTNFRMPADDLVPDYAQRVEQMRAAGVDRSVFLTEVVFPLLARLKLSRADLAEARALP
jgi:acyl-[acyl-carrier-protein] desaturase